MSRNHPSQQTAWQLNARVCIECNHYISGQLELITCFTQGVAQMHFWCRKDLQPKSIRVAPWVYGVVERLDPERCEYLYTEEGERQHGA